jgi:glutathione S-transferase
MNPQHCLPTIKDHSNGLVLWESRAIMTYLVNKYSPGHSLYPLDAEQRALVDRALYFEAGTLFPAQAAAYYVQLWGKPIDQEKKVVYEEKLSILEKTLGSNKYLVGDKKTVADLSLMTTLVAAQAAGADLSPFPNVSRWLKDLRAEVPYDDQNQEMHDGLKAFVASRRQ